jgi:hypothetical protein
VLALRYAAVRRVALSLRVIVCLSCARAPSLALLTPLSIEQSQPATMQRLLPQAWLAAIYAPAGTNGRQVPP